MDFWLQLIRQKRSCMAHFVLKLRPKTDFLQIFKTDNFVISKVTEKCKNVNYRVFNKQSLDALTYIELQFLSLQNIYSLS